MTAERACLLAAPDLAIEPGLVAAAAGRGLDIRRRPLDAADLLAVASLEPGLSVVLSAGLPRLSHEILARCGQGRRVIGLAQTTDDAAQLSRLGVSTVVLCTTVEQTLGELCSALDGQNEPQLRTAHAGVWATGAWDVAAAQPSVAQPSAARRPSAPRPPGRVIAVWGPAGAPGRTTTALLIAQLLARTGGRICMVDADTSASSLMELLGIAEHASSLVVCCRLAERGGLPASRLTEIAHVIDGGMQVLGGVGQPESWADLRPAALSRVLQTSREACDFTVVDIGAGLEPGRDVLSSERFGAARAVLAEADATVAVARASALGLTRLLQRLPLLDATRAGTLAVALTPLADPGSTRAAARSLREYGCAMPLFELPQLTTEQLVQHGPPRGARRARSRSALGALRSWLQAQGEGSTTTAVPTLANL